MLNLAISGMGAVASVGDDVDALFDNLCAGKSGRALLRGFDRDNFRAQHAYEIDDRPSAGIDVMGRASSFLTAAIGQAVKDAGLGDDLSGVPILVGTGLRELRSLELWWRGDAGDDTFDSEDLHFAPALKERFNADQVHTFSNACSASLYALALGSDLMTNGGPDVVVVAGVDVLTESMYGLLERVHPTAPDRVRPFDRNRTGVLMGDGAAAIVLRRVDEGYQVRGRLRAASVNCDAFHATAPSPTGIAGAMRRAYEMSEIAPRDIDLVMLHGTGTLLNDEAEAVALAEVMGDDADKPLMTAIKSMTGHTSGGSGLLNLVVGLTAMERGVVPPTIGLDEPVDVASEFRFVVDDPACAELSVMQLNAFGFGGINAVVIVEMDR